MTAALAHAVNGFFDAFRSKSSPQVSAQPASRAGRVKVESRYNDGDESLLESATSLPRPTLKALEKAIRADGFKGAQISGWGQGERGGFTVHYGGEQFEFEISENVTPRPTGEIGRLVKESGRYEQNGRGLYHGTNVAKNDMVIHQDHRGRWRIDLVTSAGGNHTDVTEREVGSGANSGYSSDESAFQSALDIQRKRGIRGKSHVWIADRDGNLSDYEPMQANGRQAPRPKFKAGERVERDDGSARGAVAIVGNYDEVIGGYRYKVQQDDGARIYWNESSTRPEGHSRNGRRTGILSDGTRINVYHDDTGSGDPWTVVPHGIEWDQQARGDMRQVLGMSETAAGISEWSEGQEGRHLGRSVPWDAVPEGIKRHIERRVAQEANMVANPRKSARKPKVESREDRIRREWDDAEAKGLVRMVAEPEIESYFDVYGEPDSAEERQEIEERIDRDGVYMYAAQYLSQDTGDWKTADSIGMIFGDIDKEGYYEFDLKESALKNIFGGHTPNARGTTADANAVRELSLYIENDFALIGAPNSKGKSIDGNLRKKVAAGKYDPKLAPTLWGYLIEDGARKYAKEYATPGDWAQMFNAATRKQVAEDFARAWEAENLR